MLFFKMDRKLAPISCYGRVKIRGLNLHWEASLQSSSRAKQNPTTTVTIYPTTTDTEKEINSFHYLAGRVPIRQENWRRLLRSHLSTSVPFSNKTGPKPLYNLLYSWADKRSWYRQQQLVKPLVSPELAAVFFYCCTDRNISWCFIFSQPKEGLSVK